MSMLDILALVWVGSLIIIAIDAVIFLRRAEKRNAEVACRRVLNSLLTTVPVAPSVAVIVLISWYFALIDAIEEWILDRNVRVLEWMRNKGQKHETERD